jgi:hypothetical protein
MLGNNPRKQAKLFRPMLSDFIDSNFYFPKRLTAIISGKNFHHYIQKLGIRAILFIL